MARARRTNEPHQLFVLQVRQIAFGGLLRAPELRNHHVDSDLGSLPDLGDDPFLPRVQIGDIIRDIGDIIRDIGVINGDMSPVYRDMIGDIVLAIRDISVGPDCCEHRSPGTNRKRDRFADPVSLALTADDVLVADFDMGLIQ